MVASGWPFGHQRRVHARRDAAVEPLGRGDQLDPVAELARDGRVDRLQLLDALERHVLEGDAGVERDRREDRDLGGRVGAVHVLGRIGLGVAELLGAGQRRGVVLAARHRRQDEVRGAVDDPEHARHVVRDHRLAQHLHDRDRGAHRGLEAQLHAVALGGREQLLAVPREQLLVGRDDRLAGREQVEQVAAGRLDAAHHLGHDADLGIVADGRRSRGEEAVGRGGVGALAAGVADERAAHLDGAAGDAGDLLGAGAQHPIDGRADGAVAQQADRRAVLISCLAHHAARERTRSVPLRGVMHSHRPARPDRALPRSASRLRRDARDLARRGLHAAACAPTGSGAAARRRAVPEAGGREPDRLLQGPRA